MTDQPSGEVIMYQREDGMPVLEVRLDGESVWLSQQQMAELFGASQQNISLHLANIYADGELEQSSTHKEYLAVRREGTRSVTRRVAHYNLDAIISVGYRVRSRTATQFRIWATDRLREYLVRGYAINQHRLEQLGSIVKILARADDELVSGVADVLVSYLPGLTLLRDFDDGSLDPTPRAVPGWVLSLDEARAVISRVAAEFPADELFGRERGEALDGVIGAIYQTFGGLDLYPTVEEKAAHLLYFVVKDHPLADGNKRSGAALFVTFLVRNGMLGDADGTPRFNNNALAALTLLIATSDPTEKELMVALIIRMLTEGAA